MRTLILLVVLLLPVSGWAAPALDVVDHTQNVAYSTDGHNIYAVKAGGTTVVRKMDSALNVLQEGLAVNTINANWRVDMVFATRTPDIIFVLVQNISDSKRYLLKSVDGGLHYGTNAPTYDNNDYCLMLGDIDGTEGNQLSSVSVLYDRGFIDASIGGVSVLLMGEYNMRGDNSQVRIMRSTDGGNTWTAAVAWNAGSGLTTIQHIHTIRQNPYNGLIYIGTGDSGDGAGLAIWDGVSGFSDSNFALRGLQRYRVVDIIFGPDFVLGFADTETAGETGIWRGDFALTSWTRVDYTIDSYSNRAGWHGIRTSAGNYFFTDLLSAGSTDSAINVYGSADGINFAVVATIGITASAIPAMDLSLFELDGKLFISTTDGAGKSNQSTIVARETGVAFSGEWPEILHPVFWVSTNGTDSTATDRGWQTSTPWKTVTYALTSSRITHGSRVVVGEGSYPEGGANCVWNANGRPGAGMVVLEGQGKTKTFVYNKSDSSTVYTIFPSVSTAGDMLIRNLKLYSERTSVGGYTLYVGTSVGSTQTIYLRDMILGDKNFNNITQIRWFQNLDAKRVEFYSGGSPILKPSTDSVGSALIQNCNSDGGNYFAYLDKSSADLEMNNNTISGFSVGGVYTLGTASVVPVIKNTIFDSPGATFYLKDDRSFTETDAAIDYNLFSVSGKLTNIANSGGSHSITAEPKLKSTTDYRLRPGSPCIKAGTPISGLTTDFLGKNWKNPPSIGAYEYYRKGGSGWGNFGWGW